MNDGIVVPRTALAVEWMELVDASALLNEGTVWERVAALPLTYMNEDGSGSTVALVFSIPLDADNAFLMSFSIDITQVGAVALQLTSALAAVYGKTLEEVVAETTARLRAEGNDL